MMQLPIAQIIFIVFAVIAVGAAMLVITSTNPVRGVLSLVLVFFASAGMWMLAQAEFLALILILVYVGAVMTLFLFVVMMLDIDLTSVKRQFIRYIPFGIVIVGLLLGLMLLALKPEHLAFQHLSQATLQDASFSNVKLLGSVLYTHYVLAFELAAVLLLVAIISAISLAHRAPRNCKTQNPVKQMRVRSQDRIRIVKMSAEKSDGEGE